MRTIDKSSRIGRRDFIRTTAGAAALAAIVPTTGHQAFAETLKGVDSTGADTLLKLARDLYPHDRLADEAYRKAVTTIDGQLHDDPKTRTLLTEGLALLNQASVKLKGKPYAQLQEEGDRVSVLRSISATDFFGKMRSSMVTALYNQPDLWIKFGYEGPSYDKGGYINRGFDDLDWL